MYITISIPKLFLHTWQLRPPLRSSRSFVLSCEPPVNFLITTSENTSNAVPLILSEKIRPSPTLHPSPPSTLAAELSSRLPSARPLFTLFTRLRSRVSWMSTIDFHFFFFFFFFYGSMNL